MGEEVLRVQEGAVDLAVVVVDQEGEEVRGEDLVTVAVEGREADSGTGDEVQVDAVFHAVAEGVDIEGHSVLVFISQNFAILIKIILICNCTTKSGRRVRRIHLEFKERHRR